jgi:hypothetical protein
VPPWSPNVAIANSPTLREPAFLKSASFSTTGDSQNLGGHSDEVSEWRRGLARHGARFLTEIYTRGCHWFHTPVRLKLLHACDQWHSSRVSTFLTSSHCKSRPNAEGICFRLQTKTKMERLLWTS